MSSLFRTYETGPARAAHGFQADSMVSANSSFGPVALRSEEYAALARQLDNVVSTMKSLGSKWRKLGGLSASSDTFDTSTQIGQIQHCLKKARVQVSKAEAAEDEPDEASDAATATAIEDATKLLARAKKMIAAAIEDEDEETDEGQLETAKSSCRKVAARLASLKAAKPAAVAVKAAPTTESVAKAAAELTKQTDVLYAQLSDVVEMLSHTSRSAGMPPVGVIKAANTNGGIPSNADIEGAIDAGLLDRAHGGDARMIKNIAMQGDLVAARTRRDRSNDSGIRSLFANL
jgi:hypothetical protein